MGSRNYISALAILPEEELQQLSERLGGRSAYLWVPSRETLIREKRDRYIQHLHDQGVDAEEIAARLLISLRQVQRVLAKNQSGGQGAASLPSRG